MTSDILWQRPDHDADGNPIPRTSLVDIPADQVVRIEHPYREHEFYITTSNKPDRTDIDGASSTWGMVVRACEEAVE